MKDRIRLFLTDYLLVILFFIAANIFLRGLEYLYVLIVKKEVITLSLFFFGSIHYDTLFILFVSNALLLPALLTNILNKRAAKLVIRLVTFCLLIISLGLTQYFLIKNALLTCVLFEFSFIDIIDIVSNEFTINRLILWVAFFTIASILFYFLFFVINRIKVSYKWGTILLIGYIIVSIVAITFRRDHTLKSAIFFDRNYHFLLGNSKNVFFIKSCFNKKKRKNFNLNELSKKIENFHTINNFNYCNPEYPLIHDEDYANPLGKFFRPIDKKPNIVIIFSESLSTSFSGNQNCIGGSLTFFIDSLTMHSLYWTNFFSNSETSHGVLPNVLASLPAGPGLRGFTDMDYFSATVEFRDFKKFPNHTSIIELLNLNGYSTNYYYGGNQRFDNIGNFVKENNIGRFVCDTDFDKTKYHKLEQTSAIRVWGYNDKDLFNQSFDYFTEYDTSKPFLNIYQTLSCHSPFNLSEKHYYTNEFLKEKLRQLNITRESLNKLSDEALSSIFFADDALKSFFYKFSKRPDFANTIFIITGDHGISQNECNGIFDNYRIPLIIYSPLLKQKAEFKGVCSHIDILPSLLGLLQETYNLTFPSQKHFIGIGLDTSAIFAANRWVPLQLESIQMPNFILGNHVVYADKVLLFDSSLNAIEEFDSNKIQIIKNLYYDYKYINNYVCNKNKIWYADDVEFLP